MGEQLVDELVDTCFHGSEDGVFVIRIVLWVLAGAVCVLFSGLLVTAVSQLAYPLVTGGKPVLSIPPMAIIMYEGTMLGAIIFAVMGIIIELRRRRA